MFHQNRRHLHLQRVAHLAAGPGFSQGEKGQRVKVPKRGATVRWNGEKIPLEFSEIAKFLACFKNSKGFERIFVEISEKQGRSIGRLKREAGNDFWTTTQQWICCWWFAHPKEKKHVHGLNLVSWTLLVKSYKTFIAFHSIPHRKQQHLAHQAFQPLRFLNDSQEHLHRHSIEPKGLKMKNKSDFDSSKKWKIEINFSTGHKKTPTKKKHALLCITIYLRDLPKKSTIHLLLDFEKRIVLPPQNNGQRCPPSLIPITLHDHGPVWPVSFPVEAAVASLVDPGCKPTDFEVFQPFGKTKKLGGP